MVSSRNRSTLQKRESLADFEMCQHETTFKWISSYPMEIWFALSHEGENVLCESVKVRDKFMVHKGRRQEDSGGDAKNNSLMSENLCLSNFCQECNIDVISSICRFYNLHVCQIFITGVLTYAYLEGLKNMTKLNKDEGCLLSMALHCIGRFVVSYQWRFRNIFHC